MYRAFGTGLVRVHHTLPVSVRYPLRLVRLAVEIHYHGVAQRLDLASFGVLQALLHLEAGIAHLDDTALAEDGIMETHGLTEIKVDVDEDIFKGKPVDWLLELMLKVAASAHIEEVALRPIVHVVVRIEVAHADLDWTGEHFQLIVDS